MFRVGTEIVPLAFDAIGLDEQAEALRACTNIDDMKSAARLAQKAAASAATLTVATRTADAATDAAEAAAATDVYAATDAADAVSDVVAYTVTDARQSVWLKCIPILEAAILLGPNGRDELDKYTLKAKELAIFAEKNLKVSV